EELLAGATGAEEHYRDVGRTDAFDGLGDLHHLRRCRDYRAKYGRRRAGFEAAVFILDLVEMKGAFDDEPELVDVDRLLVEIVSAHRDGFGRALSRAVAGGDDHLGVGLQPQDFGQRRKALFGAVRI